MIYNPKLQENRKTELEARVNRLEAKYDSMFGE